MCPLTSAQHGDQPGDSCSCTKQGSSPGTNRPTGIPGLLWPIHALSDATGCTCRAASSATSNPSATSYTRGYTAPGAARCTHRRFSALEATPCACRHSPNHDEGQGTTRHRCPDPTLIASLHSWLRHALHRHAKQCAPAQAHQNVRRSNILPRLFPWTCIPVPIAPYPAPFDLDHRCNT